MFENLPTVIRVLERYEGLLVDNDEADFDLVRSSLQSIPQVRQSLGLVYKRYYNTALTYLKQQSTCKEIFILMDLDLGEKRDGFDLARAVHIFRPGIPIIAFTQMPSDNIERHKMTIPLDELPSYGFSSYISKSEISDPKLLTGKIVSAITVCENTFYGAKYNIPENMNQVIHITPDMFSMNDLRTLPPKKMGETIRSICRLDELDISPGHIHLDLSPGFGTMPPSFFSALFGESIQKLGGMDKVLEKYRVSTTSDNMKFIEKLKDI